jgi:hypothetical protein
MFPTFPKFAVRVALVSMLTLGAACGRGGGRRSDDSARAVTASANPATAATIPVPADSAPGQAAAPPVADVAPPRDADQQFLRQLADHYEDLRQVTHAWMTNDYARANRDTTADPGSLDVVVDSEQREVLAVLSRLYGENYSPRLARLTGARDALRAVVGTPPVRPAATSPSDARGEIADAALAALQRGTVLVDSNLPKLRRREVRELVVRLREAQVAHAKQIVPTTRVAR